LTIVATPASVNFGNASVSTAAQNNVATFTTNSVHIQDTRSTFNTFTFSITVTDFEETSNLSTFDLPNLSMDVNGGAAVNAVGTSNCTKGITLLNSGSWYTFADTDNDATADSAAIMAGNKLIRVMECQMTPIIKLTIPGSTASGTYRSTLSWSIA
jgi:hypothetical protein